MKRPHRSEYCGAEVGGLGQNIVGLQAVTAMHLSIVILMLGFGWSGIADGGHVWGKDSFGAWHGAKRTPRLQNGRPDATAGLDAKVPFNRVGPQWT